MNIFAGKRGNRRHSPTSFSENVALADTSYKVLYRLNNFAAERYSLFFLTSFNKDNSAKKYKEATGVSIIWEYARKTFKWDLVHQ